MGKRASHVHVIARRHIASIFESNSREMRRRMSDSHMAARSRPTKDGMLRFTAPMSGIEQYISMSRPLCLRPRRPWREMDQDVMRSLFLFHEDDAVSCGPLSGLWSRGKAERRDDHTDTASVPSRIIARALSPLAAPPAEKFEDIPRPIEDIPGAIETQAAPVPLPEAPDDPVDSGGDIEQTPETQEAEAITVTNTEPCDEIADDEEWVMFSEDEAWVIGDSEDFEMFTAKNARSCTPSESP